MAEVVQIPSLLHEYRLIEETYRGPATVAWRAEHRGTGLAARVTIVAPPPRASREALEQISTAFRRALERAGAFSGPDLLPYDGAAEHDGFPCAITLLPEGTLLGDATALEERVSVARVMQIGSVIGHALARLHDVGLWHGYLHPANILLVGDDRPALLDPMIHAAAASAAWQAGLAVSGSPYVGVGERAFREQDPHVDVYALASILLRILTGRSPEQMLLEQIERRLPQALPTSLRQELIAALNIGGQSRPPTARTLAVHLSFDVAWLRATAELGPSPAPEENGANTPEDVDATIRQERTGSEPPALEIAQSLPPPDPAGVGDAPFDRVPSPPPVAACAGWAARPVSPREALTTPTLAASAAGPSHAYAVTRLPLGAAEGGRRSRVGRPPSAVGPFRPRQLVLVASILGLLLLTLPAGILIGRGLGERWEAGETPALPASTPLAVAGVRQRLVYEVQLGPYPDPASATDVQRSIARQWPDVWVVLENQKAYVHVLTTVYIDKAQRLADRFRQQGYQTRIRRAVRNYSPGEP